MQKFPKELTLAETQKIADIIKFDFYHGFSLLVLHSIWQSGKVLVGMETYHGICDNLIAPAVGRPIVNEIFGTPEPVCPYKSGELILVSLFGSWLLRYATGKMDKLGQVSVYVNQNDWKGSSIIWIKDHRSLKDIHEVL